MQLAIRLLIPLLIIGAGFVSVQMLKPSEEKESEVPSSRSYKKSATKVEVLSLEKEDYPILIPTRGSLYPAERTELSSENSGVIQAVSKQFNAGSFVKKGELLIQLDDTDYLLQLAEAEARVAQTEAVLSQEQARSQQAELNWKEIGYQTAPGDLVLRKPQLKEASARLVASKASLAQAKRTVERSQILAPYDGVIQERTVSEGTRLSTGQLIGVIISSEACLIRLPIAVNNLDLLLPKFKGTKVTFSNPLQPNYTWAGELVAREASVEEATKQPLFIAKIDDPFSLQSELLPLQVGQPLEAEVTGKTLENVFKIPKSAMRSPNEFFFFTVESNLMKKVITPLWVDEDSVIFREEFPEGTALITSSVPYASDGMPLEIAEEKGEAEKTEEK